MKGLRLNPRQAGAEPGDRRGGTTHGPGTAGGTPSLCEDTVPGEAMAGRGPGGRERAVRIPRGVSRCQVRGKRRFLRTSGAGKRSGLPAGSRKREPGAAAGTTDSAQAASSALLMGESSAKPTPKKGIKAVRSYRIFYKKRRCLQSRLGRGRHPRHG